MSEYYGKFSKEVGLYCGWHELHFNHPRISGAGTNLVNFLQLGDKQITLRWDYIVRTL
jgi:hypothetical protein